MKPDKRMTRLYETLTPKQRAILVLTHLCEGNLTEANRLGDVVPMKNYRIPDPEHTQWFENLRMVSQYHAVEYWRFLASWHAALAVVLVAVQANDEDDERAAECFEAMKRWATCLRSLEAALESVCKEHGIDPCLIRRAGNIESPFDSQGFGTVDPEKVAGFANSFNKAMCKRA